MAVKRIVPNIASDQLDKAKSFYAEMLDMDVVMDLGWIVMFAAASNANPQVSVATEGGSGTSVPDLICGSGQFRRNPAAPALLWLSHRIWTPAGTLGRQAILRQGSVWPTTQYPRA